MRIAIPLVLAALCLIVAGFTGSVLTVVLLVAALCLVLDGGLAWWAKTGGMSQYRQ